MFSATTATTQPEQVYVRFDKPFYVVGEQIWYKAFFLNEEVESKLLHIDWFGPQGQLLLQQKLTIEEGSSFGDLTIPLDWIEGHYHFRAYTQSMLNYGDELIFSRDIAIYNDFEKEIEAEDFSFEEPEKCSGNLQIDLLSNRNNYKKRARVEVRLKVENERQSAVAADLSVAVTALDLAPLMESTTICEAKAKYDATVSATPDLNYQPEAKLTIRGRVNDPETGAAVQSKFLVVFIPEQQALINIESDKEGYFEFELDTFYGDQNLQFFNLNPYQNRTPVVQLFNQLPELPTVPPRPALKRNLDVLNYLELSQKRRKIEALFDQELINWPDAPVQEPNQLVPYKNYDMRDFEAMTDVGEFMDEIVVTTRILRKNNTRSLRLFREDTKQRASIAPWYLVDGYLTDKEAAVLNMPLTEIDSIALFVTEKSVVEQFNPLFLKGGIIAVYTKNQNPPAFIMETKNRALFQGLYFPKQFQFAEEVEHEPNFQPLLYWNPALKTDESGIVEFSFPTNDIIGKFKIEVEGIAKNGAVGRSEYIFEIEF
jgi:hypothetical protein